MKLKVGIIDDEQHAIDTLKYDILDLYGDEVEIVFTETNPYEGVLAARRTLPDILFLDIVMPGMSGLEISDLLADLDIRVVFITAHAEFLHKAKKKPNAWCYLSKPVMSDELGGVFVR